MVAWGATIIDEVVWHADIEAVPSLRIEPDRRRPAHKDLAEDEATTLAERDVTKEMISARRSSQR